VLEKNERREPDWGNCEKKGWLRVKRKRSHKIGGGKIQERTTKVHEGGEKKNEQRKKKKFQEKAPNRARSGVTGLFFEGLGRGGGLCCEKKTLKRIRVWEVFSPTGGRGNNQKTFGGKQGGGVGVERKCRICRQCMPLPCLLNGNRKSCQKPFLWGGGPKRVVGGYEKEEIVLPGEIWEKQNKIFFKRIVDPRGFGVGGVFQRLGGFLFTFAKKEEKGGP